MEAVFLPEDMEVKGCGFGFVGLLATSVWRLSWVRVSLWAWTFQAALGTSWLSPNLKGSGSDWTNEAKTRASTRINGCYFSASGSHAALSHTLAPRGQTTVEQGLPLVPRVLGMATVT